MTGSCHNQRRRRRRACRLLPGAFRAALAFSLIELMIAIVILGFGMVMAATMFPVGWSRARDLSEHTVEQSVTDSVYSTLQSLMQVSGPDFRCAGFAGDLIFTGRPEDADLGPATIRWPSDTRVHALHLENIRVENPAFVPENPWRLEWMGDTFVYDLDVAPEDGAASYLLRSYFTPRIRFHERLYPPIKPRSDPDLSVADETWDDTLDSRRYCWAVFHRLREIVGPGPGVSSTLPPQEQAQLAILDQRVFDMYFVTLRRPRTAPRFAVQDPDSAPNPYDRSLDAPAPADLGPQDDVVLPVPWRMQINFDPDTVVVGDDQSNPTDPTHLLTYVPTEVTVEVESSSQFALDIFQDGTVLIDEVSGQIYRVAKQRLRDEPSSDMKVAVLTLGREIVVEDLDDGDTAGDGTLLDDEFRRAVWVFPPPVLPRDSGDDPVFEGRSPVVGIEVRTLSISPNPG